jgi:hypothetical protein
MTEDRLEIDEFADWTALGSGRTGARPGRWYRAGNGQWKRSGLLPFGRIGDDHRSRLYVCAECETPLEPTTRRYYFGCVGCGLVFGFGWGGLWGYPSDHEKAMFLTGRRPS